MAGLNVAGYAGLGVGVGAGAGAGVPQAQAPYPPQPQYQYQQYYPYGYPPAPVPAPPVTHHQNSGTQSIGGKTEQSGTFKGHGTGASIQGGFTASGSIA